MQKFLQTASGSFFPLSFRSPPFWFDVVAEKRVFMDCIFGTSSLLLWPIRVEKDVKGRGGKSKNETKKEEASIAQIDFVPF